MSSVGEMGPSCWVGLLRIVRESRQEHTPGWEVECSFSSPSRGNSDAGWHPARFGRATVCVSVDVHTCKHDGGGAREFVHREIQRLGLKALCFHVLFYGLRPLYHPKHRTKSCSGF